MRLIALATAAALVAVAVLAACGTNASSGGSTSSSDEPEETVTFGTGTITLNLAIPFTAMGLGLFAKAHLNTKFVVSTSAATLLADGQADMVFDQPANVPLMDAEGKKTKAIAAVTENTTAGLAASNSVKSLAQLQAMGDTCNLASLGRGILYAYQNHWVKKYHLKCKIVTLSDYTLVPGGIISGRFTAASELASNVASQVAQGNMHWLINPLASNYFSVGYGLGYNFINNAVVAEDSYISRNKSTIVRFFDVLKQTEDMMKKMSNTQIAEAIHNSGVSYYSSQSVQAIEEQLTANGTAPNVFVLNGMKMSTISNSVWTSTMHSLGAQGVQVNPDDSRWDFANGVDNAFAEQVFG